VLPPPRPARRRRPTGRRARRLRPALIAALLLSAFVLLALGAAVTTLTGRSPLRSGIRQLLFGLGAAAITYAIGHAVGAVIG